MKIHNSNRAIAALAVMAGVLLLAPLVSSLPTGIGGTSIQTAGCNCHNGVSDSSVEQISKVFLNNTMLLRHIL